MLRVWDKKSGADTTRDTEVMSFGYDRLLLLVIFLLMGIGLVMVYSASIVTAQADMKNEAFFLTRQLAYIGFSLVLMVAAINIHHCVYKRFAYVLFGLSFLLSIAVLLPGIGIEAKGASRWVGFGSVRYQPSEAIKLSWVVFMAAYLASRQDRLHRWKESWLTPTLCLGAIVVVLALQRDLGSTVICASLLLLMIFAAGARLRHLFAAFGVGAGALVLLILMEPYRVRRFISFLNPEADKQGDSWQLFQALISFGSGGWTGLGLGSSKQKLSYLPEAHTDFVFSILGEELGVVGVLVVITLFAVLVWRGFLIARRASTAFGSLLAFGITAAIGGQAIANMLVAIGLMPTKGLTLPLISYGGSSLVTTSIGLGILLNISRRQPPPAWLNDWVIDRQMAARKPKPKLKRGHA
ncbi:MAG: putative lipid II flippase FtsW [Myxococcales bacterium]|nr:putative lipid II flippase FtsW [Myxococcales bacterium]